MKNVNKVVVELDLRNLNEKIKVGQIIAISVIYVSVDEKDVVDVLVPFKVMWYESEDGKTVYVKK